MEFIRRNVNAKETSSGGSSGGYSGSTTSTIATLQTHTIYGQPFDGTEDVRGDMTDVESIYSSGDVQLDGDLIIKGLDEDGNQTGNDLHISKEDQITNFTSNGTYTFDNDVTAPKFIGNIEAESVNSTFVDAVDMTCSELDTQLIFADAANIQSLTSDRITTETLTVTKAAHFFKLMIDEIDSVGGQVILSPANAKIDIVKVTDSGNYKCYFKASVGGEQISNQFAANDQVVCQTFNAATGTSYDASNTFYWRLAIRCGTEKVNYVDYHYVILSGTDCAEGSGVPKEGDEIVTLGNRNTKNRQNAIVLSAYNSDFLDSGIKAPSMVQYAGINDYTLSTHRLNIISNGLNELIGNLKVTSGENVTDLINDLKYDRILVDTSSAVVNASDTMNLTLSGTILANSDETYILELLSDVDSLMPLRTTNNAFSYTKSITGYSAKTSKPTYYTLQLKQNGEVIEKVNIPVIFEAGAYLGVLEDSIEAAVQDVEGDIARVELKADSVTSTVSNMKVGGKNLIDDSTFSTWAKTSDTTWNQKNGTCSKTYGYMNQLGVHNISKPSNVGENGYVDMAEQILTYKLQPNTTYTLSFYAKGINGQGSDTVDGNRLIYKYKGRVTTYVYPNVGAEVSDNCKTFTTSSGWKRYSYTFTTKSDLSTSGTYKVLFRLIRDYTENDDGTRVYYFSNSYVCMPKLEEGTMATSWDSSTDDIKSIITQTANSLEAEIVEEDQIKSMISQSKNEIKAEVYNEMNEATGIDITNGSITLNANRTTINGNLSIRNADEGVILYDADGNAKAMVLNKDIPTISNLDTSESNYFIVNSFGEDLNDDTDYEFDGDWKALGTFKANDILKISGSSLALFYKDSSGVSKGFVPLNSTRYYTYSYWIQNTTTGTDYYSPVYSIKRTGTWDNNGNALSAYTKTITEAGNYRVSMVVHLLNPDTSVSYGYGLVWCFFSDKTITEYTMIGSDGLVSVKGENKFLYYGDDGFIVMGNDYNGIKIGNVSHPQFVMATDGNGNPLWGNHNSTLRSVNGPAPISYSVITGGTSQGTKKVLRVDTTYYQDDILVLKNLTEDVWIKLPTCQYTVNNKSYSSLNGKTLKIKNLTSYKCYVYVQDAGYKIYAPESASGAYYYNIGNWATEMVFTGSEWLMFRCN